MYNYLLYNLSQDSPSLRRCFPGDQLLEKEMAGIDIKMLEAYASRNVRTHAKFACFRFVIKLHLLSDY